jgi:hypothetical protein
MVHKLECLVLLILIFLSVPNTIVSSSDLVVEDVGVSNIFYVNSDDWTDFLFLVSFSDNNKAWIYSLDEGIIKQETEITLEALTPHQYEPTGKYIKIVSEEPIMVYKYSIEGGYGGTHYPSVTGEFVGKKFIVFPLPSSYETFLPTLEIWALETGLVTIRNGTESFMVPVFEGLYTKFDLQISDEDKHNIYYNITSNANIMLSTGVRLGYLPEPSETGRYVGKIHYGNTRELWEEHHGGFDILAFEPGIVTVTNLTDGSIMLQHDFTYPGERISRIKHMDNTPIKIWGEIDTFVRIGCGGGSTYLGGRVIEDNQIEYWLYLEAEWKGIIFAPEDVTFTINGTETTLKADEYQILTTGQKIHHIITPAPLIIQWTGGYNGYLIAPSGIPAIRPEVTEEETPPPDNTMIYVAIAVVAIVVVAALVYFLIRKKS